MADGGSLMVDRALSVRLVPMALTTAQELLRGERPSADGLRWHPDYPMADTITGIRMVTAAHRAAGWDETGRPDWWIHHIVVDGGGVDLLPLVVGDINFHGPPGVDGVVECGYGIVEEWWGRGVATAACRQLLAVAWRDGARRVEADAAEDNPASRRVLVKAGFVLRDDGVFEVRR